MSEKINVKIKPTGDIEFATEGFKGEACVLAVQKLVDSLSSGPLEITTTKPEFEQDQLNMEIN